MPDKVSMTRYNKAPRFLGKGRTKFDLSHSILTTGNTGELIPILCEPVVPGSTFSLKTASLTRLETSLHQTMDNAYVEFAYFFVPSRILWSHFDEYQGFNEDAWARTLEYNKPQLLLGSTFGYYDSNSDPEILPGSLLNHLCLPAGLYPHAASGKTLSDLKPLSIDQLPLRAIFSVWNEYFRDQNLDSIISWSDGDSDISLDDVLDDTSTTFMLNGSNFLPGKDILKVNRFKDVFSTALPQPQKGDPVGIKLSIDDDAPVGFYATSDSSIVNRNRTFAVNSGSYSDGDFIGGMATNLGTPDSGSIGPLVADLSGVQAGLEFTINDLRIAIALQSIRERDARTGNRLVEKLYGTWHLDVPSLELDRPEFLGGKRIPVNMMEVLQTSETGTTVLGSDAGHSKTFDSDDSFIRTFTQWGYVLGFVFVRTSRSYSQGIDRRFFAKDILSEYDPMLDNIGEMPVYKYELNGVWDSTAGSVPNNLDNMKRVFGYQEAWYWYKERNNRYSGYFQNGITGTLDSWHYGDNYQATYALPGGQTKTVSSAAYLSPSWLKEGPENVDRTIAVTQQVEGAFQWLFNIHFDMTNTFEASKYSIPNTFGF